MKHLICLITLLGAFNCLAGSPDFDLGIQAFQAKKYDTAIVRFKKSIQTHPNDISSYYNLGLSYKEQSDFGNALWAFEKVLSLNPNDGEVRELSRFCYNELHPDKEWNPRINSFQSALYSLSANTWGILAITFGAILAVCMVLFIRSSQTNWRRLYIILSFFWLPALISSVIIGQMANSYFTDRSHAIATKPVPTYSVDGTVSTVEIPAGERVRQITDTVHSTKIKVVAESGTEYVVNPKDLDFL